MTQRTAGQIAVDYPGDLTIKVSVVCTPRDEASGTEARILSGNVSLCEDGEAFLVTDLDITGLEPESLLALRYGGIGGFDTSDMKDRAVRVVDLWPVKLSDFYGTEVDYCDDDSTAEVIDLVYGADLTCETYSTSADAISAVRGWLCEYADEYDVDAIVDAAFGWVPTGGYYVQTVDTDGFWAIAQDHLLDDADA